VYKAVDNAPKRLRADLTIVKSTRRYLRVSSLTSSLSIGHAIRHKDTTETSKANWTSVVSKRLVVIFILSLINLISD